MDIFYAFKAAVDGRDKCECFLNLTVYFTALQISQLTCQLSYLQDTETLIQWTSLDCGFSYKMG